MIRTLLIPEAFAKVTRLVLWQSTPNGPPLLIPVVEGESPEALVQRYVHTLRERKDYVNVTNGADFTLLDVHAPLIPLPEHFVKKTPIVATSNLVTQLTASPYIRQMNHSFDEHRAKILLIPVGLETVLSRADLEEYHSMITRQFPALLALGGADIDPSLYDKPNTSSRNTHAERDRVELSLVRKYTSTGNGVFYAICRGHQLSCVEMGGTLHQEIFDDVNTATEHRTDLTTLLGGNSGEHSHSFQDATCHSITLVDQFNALFGAVRQFRFIVNSLHHQAVKSIPEGKGRVIAYEDEGGDRVIEAVEERDGHGHVRRLTLQFHPELMDSSPEAGKILDWMVENIRNLTPKEN